jgi:hypothetical protein
MKKITLLAISILTAITSHAQVKPDYIKLALNLLKGSTYYNHTVANVSVVQTINGQKSNINNTINCKLAFTILAIRDTLYDMEARYESMSLKMQSPALNMEYSTDKADPDLVSTILAGFKGQPIKVVMTKTGRLESVSGIDAIFERITAGFGSLQGDQKAQIKSVIEQAFGERAFKSNFEMATVIYPMVPIRKGALWTVDTQMENDRAVDMHTIYEFRDMTDNYNLIHANSTITYANKDKFVETNGLPIKYNLSGNMSADIKADKATGWVNEAYIIQNISGNTEIKDSPQSPGGMVIPMLMKSTMTVTDK